jgi:hypothetical protein
VNAAERVTCDIVFGLSGLAGGRYSPHDCQRRGEGAVLILRDSSQEGRLLRLQVDYIDPARQLRREGAAE